MPTWESYPPHKNRKNIASDGAALRGEVAQIGDERSEGRRSFEPLANPGGKRALDALRPVALVEEEDRGPVVLVPHRPPDGLVHGLHALALVELRPGERRVRVAVGLWSVLL